MNQKEAMPQDTAPLEKRPGVLLVGSANVGKRTLVSRLLSIDLEDTTDTTSGLLAFGWSMNTKYYTADVTVWLANLHKKFSVRSLPIFDQLAALVMVFDISNVSSFIELKDWVSHTDIQKFDILLCIGNKVDLLPGHSGHVEYRRRLLKYAESAGSSYTEIFNSGIDETEGSNLLGGEDESSLGIKNACMEWCSEHNIEYVEACASNVDFDKCLSVDGDSQGVERLEGALSAYMWPGMVLKSGDKIYAPSLPQDQDVSDEESEYELEYEILSAGSEDRWEDNAGGGWVSADGPIAITESSKQKESGSEEGNYSEMNLVIGDNELPKPEQPCLQGMVGEVELLGKSETDNDTTTYKFEDLEQLMGEIGNMRDSLRLMPDIQRREMAANLAMKMASMFGDSSGDEDGL
ncbi:unnamed protein product [Cuscuta epithymum]|uniref:Uncharacterized protein n=1 Tax=Cuscuta epithymum TaxID=186058 RepID=A0AAV0GF55_9ASTE|nr:unnamed protein product [Cuscuta epithymum]